LSGSSPWCNRAVTGGPIRLDSEAEIHLNLALSDWLPAIRRPAMQLSSMLSRAASSLSFTWVLQDLMMIMKRTWTCFDPACPHCFSLLLSVRGRVLAWMIGSDVPNAAGELHKVRAAAIPAL
jgi:hypothetical protein